MAPRDRGARPALRDLPDRGERRDSRELQGLPGRKAIREVLARLDLKVTLGLSVLLVRLASPAVSDQPGRRAKLGLPGLRERREASARLAPQVRRARRAIPALRGRPDLWAIRGTSAQPAPPVLLDLRVIRGL